MALLKRKRSGFADPMSVVTRFVNACNRQDAEGVASCLHADFDSIQPMFPARNFRGADQVRRNWQAIFDAEPGFKLTVLRQAAEDNTVWLELHGAGREAEVAGIFIMGIEGDRVRWARIYSGLVEPLPPGFEEAAAAAASSPANLREVPPLDRPADAAAGPVVEEDLIAPVVDIDGGGRARRRRSRRHGQEEPAAAEAPVHEAGVADEAAAVEAEGPAAVDEPVPVPVDEAPAAEEPVVTADEAPAKPEAAAPLAVDEMAAVDEMVAAEPPVAEEPAEPPAVEEPAAEPVVALDETPVEPVVAEGPGPVVAPDALPAEPVDQAPPPAAAPEPEPEPVVVEEATALLAEPAVVEEPVHQEAVVAADDVVEAQRAAVDPDDEDGSLADLELEPDTDDEPERHGLFRGRKRR